MTTRALCNMVRGNTFAVAICLFLSLRATCHAGELAGYKLLTTSVRTGDTDSEAPR
jgi:hypothetical protein